MYGKLSHIPDLDVCKQNVKIVQYHHLPLQTNHSSSVDAGLTVQTLVITNIRVCL